MEIDPLDSLIDSALATRDPLDDLIDSAIAPQSTGVAFGVPGNPVFSLGGAPAAPQPAPGVWNDIDRGLNQTYPDVRRQLGGAMGIAGGILPGALGRTLTQAGNDEIALAGTIPAGPEPTGFAGQAARTVGGMLPAVAAGLAGGPAGFAYGAGVQSGGGQYADVMDRLGPGGEQAATTEGAAMGAVSGVTSYFLPALGLFGRQVPQAVQRAAAKLSSVPAARAALRAAFTGVQEGTQEMLEEGASMLLQRVAEDDPEAWQGWQRRVALAGGLGAIGGVAVHGATGALGARSAQTRTNPPTPALEPTETRTSGATGQTGPVTEQTQQPQPVPRVVQEAMDRLRGAAPESVDPAALMAQLGVTGQAPTPPQARAISIDGMTGQTLADLLGPTQAPSRNASVERLLAAQDAFRAEMEALAQGQRTNPDSVQGPDSATAETARALASPEYPAPPAASPPESAPASRVASEEGTRETRAGLTLRQNAKGLWAWFDGDAQKTGAYGNIEDARASPEIEARESNLRLRQEEPEDFRKHSDFERLDRAYGHMTDAEIDAKIASLNADIASHAKVARREFTGQGTRRTGAAVSAQAVRDIGNEKLLLSIYKRERGKGPPAPDLTSLTVPQLREEAKRRGVDPRGGRSVLLSRLSAGLPEPQEGGTAPRTTEASPFRPQDRSTPPTSEVPGQSSSRPDVTPAREPGSPADVAARRLIVPSNIIDSARITARAHDKPAFVVRPRSSALANRAVGDLSVVRSVSGDVLVLAEVPADGPVQWKAGRPDETTQGGGTPAREPWEMSRADYAERATDKTNREDYASAWTPIKNPRGTPNAIDWVPYKGGDGMDGVLRWNDETGVGRGVLAIQGGKVSDVAVDKNFRRRGIASRLYDAASSRGATESKNTITAAALMVRHKAAVRKALAANKPVPPHVLADYPDLKPSAPAEAAPTQGASIDDIDAQLAERAFSGVSFSPERRGVQWRQDYVNTFNAVRDAIAPLAKTPEQKATLASELARFREGLASRYRDFFGSYGRVVSTMIAGPSNFPARRMEKYGDWAHKKLTEIVEYRAKAERAIRRAVAPETSKVVRSDQDNAVEVLQKKIDEAKRLQEAMRAGNKIVRNSKLTADQKVEQLKALGLRESTAREALVKHPGQGIGFPAYAFQNNLANIKRMEGRVSELTRLRGAEAREATFEGGRVVENKDAVRVQILYDQKPPPEVREKLKGRGFRWSPNEGAWQRLANEAGWRTALELTGAVETKATPAAEPEEAPAELSAEQVAMVKETAADLAQESPRPTTGEGVGTPPQNAGSRTPETRSPDRQSPQAAPPDARSPRSGPSPSTSAVSVPSGKGTAIEKARAAAAAKRKADVLDVDIRSKDYGVVTRRQLIDKELADGYRPVVEMVVDEAALERAKLKKSTMDKGWVPTGNEKHPKTIEYRELQRKIAEPVKKPEYRMMKGDGWRVLTKIEYDYATTAREPTPEPAPEPAPAPPAQETAKPKGTATVEGGERLAAAIKEWESRVADADDPAWDVSPNMDAVGEAIAQEVAKKHDIDPQELMREVMWVQVPNAVPAQGTTAAQGSKGAPSSPASAVVRGETAKGTAAQTVIDESTAKTARLAQEIAKRKSPAIWVDHQIITEQGKYSFKDGKLSIDQTLSPEGFRRNLNDLPHDTGNGRGKWWDVNEAAQKALDKLRDQQRIMRESQEKANREGEERRGKEQEIRNATVARVDAAYDLAKFKPGTVTLSTEAGPKEVKAQIYKGLAVHKEIDGDRWTITHAESGQRIKRFEEGWTREAAKQRAVRYTELADWTVPAKKLAKLGEGVVPALRAIDADLYADVSEHQTETSKILDKLDRIESAARDRIKKRQIPRGRGTGAQVLGADLIDAAIIVAMKATRASVKGGRALTKLVNDLKAEFPEKLANADAARIRRVALAIVKQANETGDFDLAAQDARGVAAAPKPTQVKATVRQATGLTPPDKTVTEPEALKAGLSKAARAAKTAFREGAREARAEALAQMREKIDALKERGEFNEAIRSEVVEFVREYAPRNEQGDYLNAASTSKNTADLARVMDRVARDVIRSDAKALGRLANALLNWKSTGRFLFPAERGEMRRLGALAGGYYQQVRAGGTTTAELDDAKNGLQRVVDDMRSLRQEAMIRRAENAAHKRNTREALSEGVVRELAEGAKPMKRADGSTEAPDMTLGMRVRRGLSDLQGSLAYLTGRENSILERRLYNDMTKGENAHHAQHRDDLAELGAIAKKHGSTSLAEMMRTWTDALGKGQTETAKVKAGGKVWDVSLTDWFDLAMMDRQTRAKTYKAGFNWVGSRDDADVVRLTGKEWTKARENFEARFPGMIRAAKGLIGRRAPAAFDVAYRLNGWYPRVVGSDYWRRRRNTRKSEDAGLPAGVREIPRRFLENLGLLQERTEDARTPFLVGQGLEGLIEHLDNLSKLTHLAEPTRAATAILYHPDVRAAISRRIGGRGWNMLETHLAESSLTNESGGAGDFWARVVRELNRNRAVAALATSVRSMIRNLGGTARALNFMDPSVLADGLAHVGSVSLRDLSARSGYFWHRYHAGGFSRFSPVISEIGTVDDASIADAFRGIARSVKAAPKTGAKAAATGAYINWQQFGQYAMRVYNAVDGVISRAAYVGFRRQAAKLHPDWSAAKLDQWAATRAEKVIRQSQNPSSAADMTHTALKVRRSGAGLFTLFTSDNQKANTVIRRAWSTGGKKAGARALVLEALNRAWGYGAVAALDVGLIAMIRAMLAGDDDEITKEIDKIAGRAPRDVLRMGVETALPIGGAYAMNAGEALAGQRADRMFDTPVADSLKDAAVASGSLIRRMTDDDYDPKLSALEQAWRLSVAAGEIVGDPSVGVRRTLRQLVPRER